MTDRRENMATKKAAKKAAKKDSKKTQRVWVDGKCPKCGTPKPAQSQTYETEGRYRGDDPQLRRCVIHVEGSAAWTEPGRICTCQYICKKHFWSRPALKYRKDCEKCGGTGKMKPVEHPAVPDTLRITCPACLYEQNVAPLDREPDGE
jgi:hypothetical protein